MVGSPSMYLKSLANLWISRMMAGSLVCVQLNILDLLNIGVCERDVFEAQWNVLRKVLFDVVFDGIVAVHWHAKGDPTKGFMHDYFYMFEIVSYGLLVLLNVLI